MSTCTVCERRELATHDEHATTICTVCAKALGVTPLPPSRRPPSPCQRCSQRRFVRVVPRELQSGVQHPMSAAYQTELRWPVFGGAMVERVDRGAGVLEMYICAACGFVEWYCQDPQRIPIGPRHMSEIVEYDSDAPYR